LLDKKMHLREKHSSQHDRHRRHHHLRVVVNNLQQ